MKKVILFLFLTSNIYAGVGIPNVGSSFFYQICESPNESQFVFIGEEIDRYEYYCDAWHGDSEECDPSVLAIWIKYAINETLQGEHIPVTSILQFPPDEYFEAVSSENEIWVQANNLVDAAKGIFIVLNINNIPQLLTGTVLEYNETSDNFIGNVNESSDDTLEQSITLSEVQGLLQSCPTTLGLEDEDLPLNFNVYPNPSTSFIYLPNDINAVEIEIFNVQGQQVYNGIVDGTISVSNFADGRYFTRVQSVDNKYYVSEFLVTN